jgi:nucleoside-diphosphate-sugar epimerase
MNFSKLEIARIIQKHLNNEIIETQFADPDRRDFTINFDKITALGFKPAISIEEGILGLLRLYSWYQPFQNYRPI